MFYWFVIMNMTKIRNMDSCLELFPVREESATQKNLHRRKAAAIRTFNLIRIIPMTCSPRHQFLCHLS